MATVLEGIEHKDKKILFTDEIKFNLSGTASHVWLDREAVDQGQMEEIDKRPDSTKLVVMVACSCEGFLSYQVCMDDIKAADFLFFFQTTLESLPRGYQYRVLADNPQWHRGVMVQESRANDFLLFNIPGLFQLNLIENSFSHTSQSCFREEANNGKYRG